MDTPSQLLVRTLLDAAPIGMATVNAEGKLTWCNPALASLAGKKPGELLGASEGEVLEFTQGDTGDVRFTATGRLAKRSTSMSKEGLAVFYVDITEQEKLAKDLQRLDTVDPISGLFNGTAISNNLEPLVSRSRRYNNPLSIVTMAITNLAQAGDEQKAVLAVSQLLRDQLRWADMVGRNNHGEFVLVLPETDKDAAVALANKIAAQLGEVTLAQAAGRPFRPLACFGVAQWTRGDDTGLLLRRASEALDTATRQGDFAISG